jgi:hypothetical protein
MLATTGTCGCATSCAGISLCGTLFNSPIVTPARAAAKTYMMILPMVTVLSPVTSS